ncbi:uncharacterized protein LOC132205364 [Neocloeon triangulifer]|uniref:uncharacterized protein LOC132205364 n=1 Tax=Neocloeon triangulifer TaxID=2078957 RepID=UPI00286F8BF1|nr:uncharacterized protein LOC132205364 [Neocloeon triangulifer]
MNKLILLGFVLVTLLAVGTEGRPGVAEQRKNELDDSGKRYMPTEQRKILGLAQDKVKAYYGKKYGRARKQQNKNPSKVTAPPKNPNQKPEKKPDKKPANQSIKLPTGGNPFKIPNRKPTTEKPNTDKNKQPENTTQIEIDGTENPAEAED